MSKELENWQKDVAAREAWERFIESPEFKRGLRVLELQAQPFSRPGEPLGARAQRQDYQAGFHMALFLMQNLPTAHYKKVQDEMPEWEQYDQTSFEQNNPEEES